MDLFSDVVRRLTSPDIAVLLILTATFALLLTEKFRNDLVAVALVVVLATTGLLTPREALAGFSSEAALVAAAVFVLNGALYHTGLSDRLGQLVGRFAGHGVWRATAVIMPAVALLSAFAHHVTTTAMMIPVVLGLSRERGIPPSKLLMPLSFAASLGTAITIIGVPAFLIANEALRQAGRPPLGIFSIAPIGLALTAVGTLYMLLAGRFVLPVRKAPQGAGDRFRLDDYFTEITVLPDSPLAGRSLAEVESDERYRLTVVGVVRGGQHLPRPQREAPIEEGDVLLVRISPEQMLSVRRERGLELHPVSQYRAPGRPEADPDEELERQLAQVIVAPGSDIVGRTLAEVDVRRRYGAIVLGIWRRQGWLQQELARIRLQGGDVLVVQGEDDALGRLAADGRFLMMVPFQGEPRLVRKAPLAGLVTIGTVMAAAMGAPLEVAMIAGAVAVVLVGCLTPGQAYRSIDTRVYVFIAGAIPLGTAMQKSGAAGLVVGWLGDAAREAPPMLVLLALFAVAGTVTQLMSDAATTALLAPVAVALAHGVGVAPEAYVMTVAMGSVVAFLTPLGHHGNLLIYTPGGYRFRDFVIAGGPLTVICAVVVAVLAPVLWPLSSR